VYDLYPFLPFYDSATDTVTDNDDFIGMAANRLDYKVHYKLQKKKK